MKNYTLKNLLIFTTFLFLNHGVYAEANPVTNAEKILNDANCMIMFSTDTDGDGIDDAQDLDDDNDGIPDENECGYANYEILNGGFEDPVIPNRTYRIKDASLIPGWETTASDNKIEIWSTGFQGVPAQEGNQFVELNANQVSTLYQTFALNSLGGTVTWSLYHRGRKKVETANVKMGADLASATVIEVMTDGTSAWGHYSGTYTIPPGQTTLVIAFESIVGGSIGNFLDDIQVNINQACIDSDGDGITNDLDLDSDNDGITDLVENAQGDIAADNGGSGLLDGRVYNFTDLNLDGLNDSSTAGNLDTDGDGIPDFLDLDSDNDGIADYIESVCSSCPTGSGPPPGSIDSDLDGVLDFYESMSADNTDNLTGANTGVSPNFAADDLLDAIPDYLDEDTDGDGQNDWAEGFDVDGDGEALNDILAIASTYESNNGNPGDYSLTDTDSDGIPDWLDNQIAIAGYIIGTTPPFLDPSSSMWIDNNNNGIADLFDTSAGGVMAPTPNTDSANDDDWRDNITMASLPVELVRFEASTTGCRVDIEWTSKSEEVFNFYQLEKSTDGVNFSNLEKIYSMGGDVPQDYRSTDNFASDQTYYRLKMVDIDGSYEYSDIIMILTDCTRRNESSQVILYPNPVVTMRNTVYFKFLTQDEKVDILLTNHHGAVLNKFEVNTTAGWNSTSINTDNLQAGTYFISLVRKSGKIITKQLTLVED